MNRILILVVAALGACFAQPADDSVPASPNIMGAQYPRIQAHGSVISRIRARDAQKVQLMPGNAAGSDSGLGGGPIDMDSTRAASTASSTNRRAPAMSFKPGGALSVTSHPGSSGNSL